MKIDTYKCDGCGVQKQDANHWFKASKVKQDDKPAGVLIGHWDTLFHVDFLKVETESHLCGAACVSKWVSENLL